MEVHGMSVDYKKVYEELGIIVPEVGENYNPEMYGRCLMRGFFEQTDVTYSYATNIGIDSENLSRPVEVIGN